MGLIAWAVLGVAAGAFVRAVNDDEHQDDVVSMLAIAVVGALLGGLIASAIGIASIGSFFSPGTWLMAIAGAFLALALLHASQHRGAPRRSHERNDA